MTDHSDPDSTDQKHRSDDIWKHSPFAPPNTDSAETAYADKDTEEKVTHVAEALMRLTERVEHVTDRLNEMAEAQGTSQQADTGTAAGTSNEKIWGEDSPFKPR